MKPTDETKLVEAMECAQGAANRIMDKIARLEEENIAQKKKIEAFHIRAVDEYNDYHRCEICGEWNFEDEQEMLKIDQSGEAVFACMGNCYNTLTVRYGKEAEMYLTELNSPERIEE